MGQVSHFPAHAEHECSSTYSCHLVARTQVVESSPIHAAHFEVRCGLATIQGRLALALVTIRRKWACLPPSPIRRKTECRFHPQAFPAESCCYRFLSLSDKNNAFKLHFHNPHGFLLIVTLNVLSHAVHGAAGGLMSKDCDGQ